MRAGKVLFVMVAVLAMAAAAGAQIFTVNADSSGAGITTDILVLDPEALTPTVVSTGCSNGFRSAANAIVGNFHYAENINSPGTIRRVDITTCTVKTYARTYSVGQANNNLTADTSGTLWEIDRETGNLYALTFDDTANTVSRTLPTALGRIFNQFGDIAWGPDGQLYIATNNTSDGNFVWDGASLQNFTSSGGEYNYQGIAWYNGKLYGATAANNGSTGPGTVWQLDPDDMSTMTQIATYPGRLNDLAAWPLEEPPCETDLIAAGGDGIGIDVGSVTTQLGENGWDVLFTSTAPWEIAEVHLDVACDPSELAQTRKGNPIPGQFCFQDTLLPGSQSYLFEDVLAKFEYCNHSLCGGDECTYFAAHAVVRNYADLICDDEAGRIFGVERGTGDLYEINLTDATATIVADIDDPVPGNENSPNGLAFDVKRGFWYFSAAGVSNSTLWFWDGENQVNAGEVPGEVAGAAFFNGEYYYIVNETDDLVKVQFAEDGSVTGVLDVCSDFAGEPDTFRFGDIVISPDGSMLYGSSIGSGDPTVFFAIDMSTCHYTAISADGGDGSGLQLALGSDGKLYGHSTGTGVFYEVDPLTGTTTPLVGVDAVLGLDNPLIGAINNFTDLGAGPCSPWEETAWGSGTQFDGNNWGMYFGCNCEDESIESPE